jgi:zinc protease
VVAHNLARFVELVAAITLHPAFRPRDVQQAKREMLADLDALADDDRTLCFRHFRSFAFGDHLYGRPRGGSKESVSSLGRGQLVEHHARMMYADNVVFAAWGDFRQRELEGLLDRRFGALPARKPAALTVSEPKLARGRRILVVDKPDRTQAQLAIGTLGTSAHDRDHVPLVVGNTAFGGLFSSRLNDEVRVRRGLSYGASSSFTLSRGRDLWSMYTAPAAKDLRRCLELQLALYDRWVARGVTVRELAASKRYLVKSHAFEIDTAAKRLDQRLDVELLGFPRSHHDGFVKRVKTTTREEVGRALEHRLSRRDQTIALVATATEVLPELERIEGVEAIEVVPFDRL